MEALPPMRQMVDARRFAWRDGQVATMWPGLVLDVVEVAWFRWVWNPLRALGVEPGPDEVYHSSAGGCSGCQHRPPPARPRGLGALVSGLRNRSPHG